MSKKVDFDEVTRQGYRGKLINWETWCDGEAHQLERGVDYHGSRTDSTRSAGIQWAARHGLKVRTSILSADAFVFQVVEGLSDDMIALAKRLQAAADPASDAELAAVRRSEREPSAPREPQPKPPYDPIAERTARLSDEIKAKGGPANYTRTAPRPQGNRRRTVR